MEFLYADFNSLYESSCYALRNSIINALVEVLNVFSTDKIILEDKNSIEIAGSKICGIQIKKSYLYIIIKDSKGIYDSYKIYDKQKNKTFKLFDSDVKNWINFINAFKKMIADVKEGKLGVDTN